MRAELTPTTAFCPQSRALTVGAFRAWNGCADRHGYDLVRVRVHPMHGNADRINGRLASLEATFERTGALESHSGTGGETGAESGDEGTGLPPGTPF